MDVLIREIEPGDYSAVAALWNCELGNRAVTEENYTAVMEKMNASGFVSAVTS